MKTEKEIQLTGVFIQDPKDHGYTAFFAQFPNIVAEGDTQEDATKNLISILQIAFEDQRDHIHLAQEIPAQNVTTKGFNLKFA